MSVKRHNEFSTSADSQSGTQLVSQTRNPNMKCTANEFDQTTFIELVPEF